MREAELFKFAGERFDVVPAAALKPISLPPFSPDVGPYHKVQYVIEIVGPSLIPAATAHHFLERRARASLGTPEIYVMTPGQKRWAALWSGDQSPAYDSLAFAWDLVSSRGPLRAEAASELMRRVEEVARAIQRRAIPLRTPEECAAAAENLLNVKESLDIGMDASIEPAVDTYHALDVIRAAYVLGFTLKDSGLLEWRQQGWPEALLTMYPLGAAEEFDPKKHPEISGIGIGFSVPCNPSPQEALERLFEAASKMQNAIGGRLRDEDGIEIDDPRKRAIFDALEGSLNAFQGIGLTPGSAEALRLFEP